MSCYEAVLWSSRAHLLGCKIKPTAFQWLSFLKSQSELYKSARKNFEKKIEEIVFYEICEDRTQRLRPLVCWEDHHSPTSRKKAVRTKLPSLKSENKKGLYKHWALNECGSKIFYLL